jgi:hypothetical protein
VPRYKFRSVEDLEERALDLCSRERDRAWFRRVAKLWEASARLNPRRFPRGAHRYRSLEEAQAEREAWLKEHVTELRRSRQLGTEQSFLGGKQTS